jgi:hypothetical protein
MTPIVTVGPGGVFKVNHGSNDYFTVNQSNGTITLMPPAAGNQQGSIFKGTDPFLHTYHGSGTIGFNTFVGINAGNFTMGGTNFQGSNNTGVGYQALTANTTGYQNTAIGSFVLSFNTTGAFNTANGFRALYSNTTGSGNTAIGISANSGADNRTNTIVLAAIGNITPTGNNQVRIGNAAMTSIGGQVDWSTHSDERTKTNFRDDVPGLAFIMKLKPLTYQYDVDKENELMGIKKQLPHNMPRSTTSKKFVSAALGHRR